MKTKKIKKKRMHELKKKNSALIFFFTFSSEDLKIFFNLILEYIWLTVLC